MANKVHYFWCDAKLETESPPKILYKVILQSHVQMKIDGGAWKPYNNANGSASIFVNDNQPTTQGNQPPHKSPVWTPQSVEVTYNQPVSWQFLTNGTAPQPPDLPPNFPAPTRCLRIEMSPTAVVSITDSACILPFDSAAMQAGQRIDWLMDSDPTGPHQP